MNTESGDAGLGLLRILIQEDRPVFEQQASEAPVEDRAAFEAARLGEECGGEAGGPQTSDVTAARAAVATLKEMRPKLKRQLEGLKSRRQAALKADHVAEVSQILFNLVAGSTAAVAASPDLSRTLNQHAWLWPVVLVFFIANTIGRWRRKTASGGDTQARLAEGVECFVAAEDLIDQIGISLKHDTYDADFRTRVKDALALVTRIRKFQWE
jgi:xanthine dehydrogenase molybdopterin-binding subunit B